MQAVMIIIFIAICIGIAAKKKSAAKNTPVAHTTNEE